jgi:peroxin-7
MNGFSTQGFAGYSVSFSPFYPDLLATATASNFGIVGNGKLFVSSSKLAAPTEFQSQDGLFDVAFSEIHDKQIVTGSGDGSIHLWDWSLPVLYYN